MKRDLPNPFKYSIKIPTLSTTHWKSTLMLSSWKIYNITLGPVFAVTILYLFINLLHCLKIYVTYKGEKKLFSYFKTC